MENEQFDIWEPQEAIDSDIYFYEIKHDGEYLYVLLKKLNVNDKFLSVRFKGVFGYRVFTESSRIKTLHELSVFRGFRTSTNSEFLNWFKKESSAMFNDVPLTHYVICNIDNIIEVISAMPVSVEWISTTL